MNFATLKTLLIPEGVVNKIESGGRLLWTAGAWPAYYTQTRTNISKVNVAAARAGNYALLAGGCDATYSSYYSSVSTFNSALTLGSCASLDYARRRIAATTLADMALFGGGYGLYATEGYFKKVDVYSSTLTQSATALGGDRADVAATTVGGFALFGGGRTYDYQMKRQTYVSNVDAFDAALTRRTASSLSVARGDCAAATVGNYALFGGGYGEYHSGEEYGYTYSNVDAYDSSLTRTTAPKLSAHRYNLAATHVGDYALFGGGYRNADAFATVEAYNTSLTRTIATPLPLNVGSPAATTLGDYAIFAGGFSGGGYANRDAVNAYNKSLTRKRLEPLREPRQGLAATTLGAYALFANGLVSDDDATYYVDVYSLSQ